MKNMNINPQLNRASHQPEESAASLESNSFSHHFGGIQKRIIRPLLLITSAAACMSLSSCLVPNQGYSNGSSGYNSYQSGYRVNSLPSGYRTENISGNTYYYHDGHYYRQSSGGYVVADAPRSSRYYNDYDQYRSSRNQRDDRYSVISRLPDGHRVINHRGKRYYQSGSRYYVRQNDGYTMVKSPY